MVQEQHISKQADLSFLGGLGGTALKALALVKAHESTHSHGPGGRCLLFAGQAFVAVSIPQL